jgi:hypothetical protein
MSLPEIPIERALQYLRRGHRLIYREVPSLGEPLFIIAARPQKGYPSTWKRRIGIAKVDFFDMQKIMGRYLITGKIRNVTPKFLKTKFYEKWYEFSDADEMDISMLVKKRNKQLGR